MIALTDQQADEIRTRIDEDCRRMKSMLIGLGDAGDAIATEVHGVRKLGKALRGGFAMLRLRKSAARDLQAIGRMLSTPRDAVARLETWKRLGWQGDSSVAAAVTGLLEGEATASARRPPAESLAWCLERVDSAIAKLAAIDPTDLPSRATKGLAKLERQVAKRCKRLDRRVDESFHEARKAIKAWLGAVALLPDDLRPADPDSLHLAKLLGDENDLANLSCWLERHGFTGRFAPDLRHSIELARKDLQLQAVALGGRP